MTDSTGATQSRSGRSEAELHLGADEPAADASIDQPDAAAPGPAAQDRPDRAGDGPAAPQPERDGLEQTRDDTDAGWGEYPDQRAHDRWLDEQRPPHWE